MSFNPSTITFDTVGEALELQIDLGYFWNRIFKDKAVLKGLLQGMASGEKQDYTDLINAIYSFSAQDLPIFDTRNWYPLVISKFDLLDNNTLLYGEGVLYGATVSSTPYTYGSSIPEANGIYSVIAPKELKSISIIADKIIYPSTTWVSGTNVELRNGRLFFTGNPFAAFDSSLTEITLWCYNAALDSDNLWNNVGYMFGLALDHTTLSKNILASLVTVVTEGASIGNLTNLCKACLNTSSDSVVEVVDNIKLKNWWNTELVAGPAQQAVPLYLPPHIFIAGYRQTLQFNNSSEPVSFINGILRFPVQGSPKDMRLFNDTVCTNADFLTGLNNYLKSTNGQTLFENNSQMMNPVDFVFKSFLGSATTLIRVKLSDTDQLNLFQTVLYSLRSNLPKHVMLIVLCDVTVPMDTYSFSSDSVTDTLDMAKVPLTQTPDTAYMNHKSSGAGLLIQDMLSTRTITSGWNSEDHPLLSFTLPQS